MRRVMGSFKHCRSLCQNSRRSNKTICYERYGWRRYRTGIRRCLCYHYRVWTYIRYRCQFSIRCSQCRFCQFPRIRNYWSGKLVPTCNACYVCTHIPCFVFLTLRIQIKLSVIGMLSFKTVLLPLLISLVSPILYL